MQVENLIFAYILICISMIAFNIIALFYRRTKVRINTRKKDILEQIILEQMEIIDMNGTIPDSHLEYLLKTLKYTNNLMIFDEALSDMEADKSKYLQQIRPVFVHITMVFFKKNLVDQAYYAYILKKYRIGADLKFSVMHSYLIHLMSSKSLYCRQNALLALYAYGNAEFIALALQRLDENHMFHHRRLIAEGLMSVQGDKDELIKELISKITSFNPEIQIAVLNYIRQVSSNYCEMFADILNNERENREVRLIAIRYFEKYKYQPIKQKLIEFVENEDILNWEFAAVSAHALHSYPGEDTVRALKKSLHSRNWYVRLNSAKSLVQLDTPYLALSEILTGKDRYAREILQYCLDNSEKIKERSESA